MKTKSDFINRNLIIAALAVLKISLSRRKL